MMGLEISAKPFATMAICAAAAAPMVTGITAPWKAMVITIAVEQFSTNNGVVKLRVPIQVTMKSEGGIWEMECPELEFFTYGEAESIGAAKKIFQDDLGVYYDDLCQEGDDELGESSLAIRRKLLGLME